MCWLWYAAVYAASCHCLRGIRLLLPLLLPSIDCQLTCKHHGKLWHALRKSKPLIAVDSKQCALVPDCDCGHVTRVSVSMWGCRYVSSNPQYADASSYASKFRQLQQRAMATMRTKVAQVLQHASQQVTHHHTCVMNSHTCIVYTFTHVTEGQAHSSHIAWLPH